MDDLLWRIDEIDRIKNEAWLATLDERNRIEMEFHDRDRDSAFREEAARTSDTFEKFYGNKKHYNAAYRSNKYIDGWIATHAKGKVFLGYACSNGQYALHAARSGAGLALGLDISNVSVHNARHNAEGMSNSATPRRMPRTPSCRTPASIRPSARACCTTWTWATRSRNCAGSSSRAAAS